MPAGGVQADRKEVHNHGPKPWFFKIVVSMRAYAGELKKFDFTPLIDNYCRKSYNSDRK
jgi:hypothetical protein